MKKNNFPVTQLENKVMEEEEHKIALLKANVVKEDINQLLMYLGANNDADAIAKKLAQLGRDLADLEGYLHHWHRERGPIDRPLRRAGAKARPDIMMH